MEVMNKEEIMIDPELECSVCNDLLFKPVSINCGHTFCRECLGNIIKTKPQCPLCRTPCFLQENNLKENITLRTIIENKYSSHIARRKEGKVEKKEEAELVQEENDTQESREQNFNPMIVLPLQKGIKKTVFPGSENQTVVVRLNFDPSVLKHVCNDNRVLAVPESKIQEKSEFQTCILEIVNLEPHSTAKDFYTLQVKVHGRVMVKEYSSIELDQKILESWGYTDASKVICLPVGKGCFVNDNNSRASFEQIQNYVAQIEEFFNEKIDYWSRASPESAHFVMQKMMPVLQTGNDRSMEYFINFSFAAARLLRSSEEEKRRMFETTNTLERLLVLKEITNRFKDTVEFSVIIETELVGQNTFGILTIVIIIALIIPILSFLLNPSHKY